MSHHTEALTPAEDAASGTLAANPPTWRSLDESIRCLGYAIEARPSLGDVLWARNGRVFTQAAVIQRHRQLRRRFGSPAAGE